MIKTCPICGNEYQTSIHNKVTCSGSCRLLYRKKMSFDHYWKDKERKLVTKPCAWCQQPFESTASAQRKFCSPDCREEFQKKARQKSYHRKVLRDMGISFTEETLDEVWNKSAIKKHDSPRSELIPMTEADRRFQEELRAHRQFRDSIKRETLAKDEEAARKLGVSYGIYVALYKSKRKGEK